MCDMHNTLIKLVVNAGTDPKKIIHLMGHLLDILASLLSLMPKEAREKIYTELRERVDQNRVILEEIAKTRGADITKDDEPITPVLPKTQREIEQIAMNLIMRVANGDKPK